MAVRAHQVAVGPAGLATATLVSWHQCRRPIAAPAAQVGVSCSTSRSCASHERGSWSDDAKCLVLGPGPAHPSCLPRRRLVALRCQKPSRQAEVESREEPQARGDAAGPPGESPPGGDPPRISSAEEVDRRLSAMWEDLKREMRKEVDPESARLLDSLPYEELTGPNAMRFFRRLADAQLGPILEAMGVRTDPLDFFIEVIKLATFLQFVTCGLVWFNTQSIMHLPAGQPAIATAGMALGYLTRPAFKIERLLFPVYNSLLQLVVPNASYVVTPSSREEVQGTLNQLGIALAVAFLLPRAALGWDVSDSTAFVVPLTMGWFLFDVTYLAGLLLLLPRSKTDD